MTLPQWFILQPPPDKEITIGEWKEFTWDRVKLLSMMPVNRIRIIRDHFPLTIGNDLDQIYENYRLGSYLLRIVATKDIDIKSWLIHSEGDLFEYLYEDRASKDQKRMIFNGLFGSSNVLDFQDFKYNMNEEQNERLAELYTVFLFSRRLSRTGSSHYRSFLICVYSKRVPWMVSTKRGYLCKGWVVAEERQFRKSLKDTFELKLSHEIEKTHILVGREDLDRIVKEITEGILQALKKK